MRTSLPSTALRGLALVAALAVTAACSGTPAASPSSAEGGATSTGAADAGDVDLSGVTLVVGDVGGWLEDHLGTAGLLEDLPYSIDFKDVGGANAYSTLSSGQIDAGVWGFDANGAQTITGGSDARIIGLIGPAADADPLQGNINLFVATDAGIETPEDLAGKTIGVNWGQGTTADVVLHAALAEAGLTPSDLDVKYFTDATGATAYLSGQLDGFVTSYNGPFVESINNGDSEVLYFAGQASAVAYVLTSREAVTSDPEKSAALSDFVTRVTEYYDWRGEEANRDAFAQALADQQSIDLELAGQIADLVGTTVQVREFDDAAVAAYQADLDDLVTWELMPENVDVEDLIDRTYADSISAARN